MKTIGMALRSQQQQHYSSIYLESLIFRNRHGHGVVKQLLSPRRRRYVSASLQQTPPLPHTILPLLLHSNTHSLPIPHFTLLSPTHFSTLLRPRIPRISSPMCSLTDSNSNSNSTVPATITDRVVIKGRVQGVFYRDWTVQNATELGLKGWVRNRRNGSVEVLLSGPPEKVHEMEQRCRRGPPSAAVTGFDASPSNDDPGTGFERRPTV